MVISTIETDNLFLKPLNTSFLSKKYVDWLNDPEVIEYMSTGGNYTLDKLNSYLLEVEKSQMLFWAITIKKQGDHIGNIKIDPIALDKRSGEYGIMIGDKKYWGKGFGKEASSAIINFCFSPSINLFEITLGVKKDNFKAINLYRELGFIEYNNDKKVLSNNSEIRMFLKK